MNIAYKAFCRTFQTVFKIAIPFLPYRNPQVVEHVTELPFVFEKKGITSVLLVTDKAMHELGTIDPLKEALEEHHINYTIYDGVVPNPTISNVEAARALYLENHCQALIGFGGGSSIDCAKAVGARIARPKMSIQKMKGILKIMKKLPFLVAIPTTAGTGSEATLATVITDDSTDHKFPINDFPLIPRVAVLDAELTRTLPPHLTATTGMDALTHAIEAYIGRSTVPSTRRAALRAASLIADNLETAYQDGNNRKAREKMLEAAFLAGKAFSKSYVGYCHAVAHSLGGKYHTPHGLANAVLLPYVLEAYGDAIYKKGKDIAVAMKLVDRSENEQKATEKLIAHIRHMNQVMEIPEKLSGIQEKDISKLAGYAAKEANPLYPVPVLMSKKELEQFYYKIMK